MPGNSSKERYLFARRVCTRPCPAPGEALPPLRRATCVNSGQSVLIEPEAIVKRIVVGIDGSEQGWPLRSGSGW